MYICNERNRITSFGFTRENPRKWWVIPFKLWGRWEGRREWYYLPIIYCGRVILLPVLRLDIGIGTDWYIHNAPVGNVVHFVLRLCRIGRFTCIRIANDIRIIRIADKPCIYTYNDVLSTYFAPEIQVGFIPISHISAPLTRKWSVFNDSENVAWNIDFVFNPFFMNTFFYSRICVNKILKILKG